MCGIAGYYGTKELSRETIQSTLGKMHHRGPDHSAYRHWGTPTGKNVYLLHSRLSIIDLDPRSHQPFMRDGRAIVFNGEIYNYKEVRERLIQQGESFDTPSDTEVLLRALHRNGLDGLPLCEGMWAFAYWNEQTGELVLSRDRFGEKPLYLYRDETGLYFGSEIKFIQQLLGQKLKINQQLLLTYLLYGYRWLYKNNETFFEKVTELPRASSLRIDSHLQETLVSYWSPSYQEDSTLSYAASVQGIRERLLKAVQLRMRADVPLAFCMSGGVDSNTLIGIAKKVFNYDVHGFTIMNTDRRYDEREMVELAVKWFGIRHTPVPIHTTSFLQKLRKLVVAHDAPVYTISLYSHWLLMESIASHGYKISMSGTGADELFTGYYDHHLFYLAAMKHHPARYPSAKQEWGEHIAPIVLNPFLKDPERFSQTPDARDHLMPDLKTFSNMFQKKPALEAFQETRYTQTNLRNRMLNEMFHESVPPILHEDDHNAMYFSIENRSPFLDKEVFEFANRIPTEHLIQRGYAKVVLRDAMEGIVPDEVRYARRKVGFNAPILSFLDPKNSEVQHELLRESPIFDILKREAVLDLLDQSEMTNSQSLFLFYFLNAKIFLEEFGG